MSPEELLKEQQRLHDLIQRKNEIALQGVAEMQKNPFSLEQKREQANEMNRQAGRSHPACHRGADAVMGSSCKRSKDTEYEIVIKRQEELLEKYAHDTGCWFDYRIEINTWEFIDCGEEAEVFESDNQRYINKVIRYNVLEDITPQQFIDNRITLHNYLFPETKYELLGFTRDGRGEFAFVLKQAFIQKWGDDLTADEVAAYLKEKMDLDAIDWSKRDYCNSNYLLGDIHLKNVIRGEYGIIYFIDTQTFLNEPEKGYGGVRTYKPFGIEEISE